jgi:hypothetical protein
MTNHEEPNGSVYQESIITSNYITGGKKLFSELHYDHKMELNPNNVDTFIKRCIQNVRNDNYPVDNASLKVSSDVDQNSLLIHYIKT